MNRSLPIHLEICRRSDRRRRALRRWTIRLAWGLAAFVWATAIVWASSHYIGG